MPGQPTSRSVRARKINESERFSPAQKAAKRSKMSFNPCLGTDKVQKTDPNANRGWEPEECHVARENAPLDIKMCLFPARCAGSRGRSENIC